MADDGTAERRPMDFSGRPMASEVYVGPEGTASDADLRRRIARAEEFVATPPPKWREVSPPHTDAG